MAEIRVQVPDEVMTSLKNVLGLKTNVDVIEEALTILNWAAEEKQQGRQIYSQKPGGGEPTRLAMKSLRTTINATYSRE